MLQKKLLRWATRILSKHGIIGANTINAVEEYIATTYQ